MNWTPHLRCHLHARLNFVGYVGIQPYECGVDAYERSSGIAEEYRWP